MIGTIAALKVTGERVFVLANVDEGFNVRRPVIGPNGISHVIEYFTPDELESTEASIRRELQDIILKRKLENELYAEYQKELSAKQLATIEDATETDTDPDEPKTNVIKFPN